jgi:hypothetical protein
VQPLGALVLLALAAILVVTSIVTVNVVRRMKTGTGKLLASVAIPMVAILVVFGDELAGVVYMHSLCRAQTNRVYKTVELPASYFKQLPQDVGAGYMPDEKQLRSLYDFRIDDQPVRHFRVNAFRLTVIEKTSGEKLGEADSFNVGCGWFQNMFGIQCVYGCRTERTDGPGLLSNQIFRRASPSN